MQLLQSRALPLGYPATGTRRLILFRPGIKLCFATVEAPDLTAPVQISVLSRCDLDSGQLEPNCGYLCSAPPPEKPQPTKEKFSCEQMGHISQESSQRICPGGGSGSGSRQIQFSQGPFAGLENLARRDMGKNAVTGRCDGPILMPKRKRSPGRGRFHEHHHPFSHRDRQMQNPGVATQDQRG